MRLRGEWGAGRGERRLLALVCLMLATMVLTIACRDQNAGGGAGDSARAVERSPGAASVGSTGASLPTPHSAPRTVLFIGTSLTAGLGLDPDSAYPQMIARRIETEGLPFTVVNAGVSGETTAGLLARLDWLLRRRARVIVVESGANDGLRGVPVATMRRNLEEILARVRRAQPDARILLVQMEAPPNLGESYTRAFRAVYPEVARNAGVELLPFLLDGVAGHPALNQADGIHPNLAGEQKVADNVWKGLEPVLRAEAANAR